MPNSLNNSLRSRLLVAGLLVPAVLVILLAVIAYRMAAESDASFKWVSHTYTVINTSDAAMKALLDSETSVRGYILTGQQSFLKPFEKQSPELPTILDQLQSLTVDNAVQQTNITELRGLAVQKIDRMNKMVAARKEQSFEAAQQMINGGEGQSLMDQIREVNSRIKDEELRLLQIRENHSRVYASMVQTFCLAFLAASIVMLALFSWLAVKLQRLQNLVTVCAWTQRVQYEGKWIRFEEYLLKRFNIRTTHGMSADAAAKMRAELEVLSKPKTST